MAPGWDFYDDTTGHHTKVEYPSQHPSFHHWNGGTPVAIVEGRMIFGRPIGWMTEHGRGGYKEARDGTLGD